MSILKQNFDFLNLFLSFIFFIFIISFGNYFISELVTYLTAFSTDTSYIPEIYGTFLYFKDFVYSLEYSFISVYLVKKLISNLSFSQNPINYIFNGGMGLILLPIFISFSNYFLNSFLDAFLEFDFFILNDFSQNLINNFYIIYILNFIFFIASYIFSSIITKRRSIYENI